MRIALFADIHANRQAFEACLAAAAAAAVDRFVVLGDIVGYGADPGWCVDRVRALAAAGAMVVCGNHDLAVATDPGALPGKAGLAACWTRAQLDPQQLDFLARLPLTISDADRYYVHAQAVAPGRWDYVQDEADAQAHFSACPARLSFCGHVHRPALFGQTHGQSRIERLALDQDACTLLQERRWLAVVGSIGQPRDGNPAAAWCLLDTASNQLHFLRTDYNLNAAMASIALAGLPDEFGWRLAEGY